MIRTAAAIVIGFIVVVIAFDAWVNQRSADDLLRLAIGTIYQSFTPEPPAPQFVDEAIAGTSSTSRPRLVQLLGSARSVERRDGATHFLLERHGTSVQVSYSGVMPPTFTEGGLVLVTGALDGEGQLRASGLAASARQTGP